MARVDEAARKSDVPARLEPISVRIREACRLTGIGRSKFYELVASGDIEVIKVGSITLVPFEGLRQFIDRARSKPAFSEHRKQT
jgi:excisionase family DNA binding protein